MAVPSPRYEDEQDFDEVTVQKCICRPFRLIGLICLLVAVAFCITAIATKWWAHSRNDVYSQGLWTSCRKYPEGLNSSNYFLFFRCCMEKKVDIKWMLLLKAISSLPINVKSSWKNFLWKKPPVFVTDTVCLQFFVQLHRGLAVTFFRPVQIPLHHVTAL